MNARTAGIALVLLLVLTSCSSGSASPRSTSTSPPTSVSAPRATARASGTTMHWRLEAKPGTPKRECSSSQLCVLLATESGRLRGDLQGTSFAGGSTAFAKSGHFVVARTDVFRGTVKGCGTGTLVLVGTELADLHGGTGEWRIAEGFGTGDLAHVTGHGTGRGTVDANGFHSQWEGEVDCGR